MPVYTALTTLPGEQPAQNLGLALEAVDPSPTGIGVFEVEDGSGLWEVGGYFEGKPDDVALDLLAAAHGAKPFAISEVPETDWVAHVRRELAPVTAGRFFLYGSHDADKVPSDKIPLLIEAATAFGTGHHGTTLGCLLEFDAALNEGAEPANILDLGCGTAVLAIAAAKSLDQRVIATDIDPVATEVASANAKANDVASLVECLTADGLDDARLSSAAPFDLIFANILKGPLLELAPAISNAMTPNGQLILSGIMQHQADETRQRYAEFGFKLLEKRDISDWATLRLMKQAS